MHSLLYKKTWWFGLNKKTLGLRNQTYHTITPSPPNSVDKESSVDKEIGVILSGVPSFFQKVVFQFSHRKTDLCILYLYKF